MFVEFNPRGGKKNLLKVRCLLLSLGPSRDRFDALKEDRANVSPDEHLLILLAVERGFTSVKNGESKWQLALEIVKWQTSATIDCVDSQARVGGRIPAETQITRHGTILIRKVETGLPPASRCGSRLI